MATENSTRYNNDASRNKELLKQIEALVEASKGTISWVSIGRTLGIHKDRARSLWRRFNQEQPTVDHMHYTGVATKVEAHQKVLKTLRTQRTLGELSRVLKVAPTVVLQMVEELKGSGYQIVQDIINGNVTFLYIPKPEYREAEIEAAYTGGETIKVALVSDTHMGSNFYDATALKKFYKYAYDNGVRKFYHVGDLTDGFYRNRETSWFEQYAHGFTQQVTDVVENYPRIGDVETYFITGK